MSGLIEAIYTAARHGEVPTERAEARLETEVGLHGDRYSGSGIVSLIEVEEVEAFNAATGLDIGAAQTGRNILTRGLGLNALVGRRFRVGDAVLEGTELCEPCATLGTALSTPQVSRQEVVRQFAHKAGIRARVLTSGTIAPGSRISV